VAVLHDVSLVVHAGETVTIVGANGAGKSTLMKVIAGLLPPTRGTVHLHDQDITGMPAYRLAHLGIALVPENRRVFPAMTVHENLRLGAYHRSDARAVEADLEWIWRLFPILRERRGQMAETLSGGQQQMLAIGRALLGNPRVLLLDEPSEGLSPVIVDELAQVFSQIAAAGTGLLMVEQHLKLVRRVSQRFVVMAKGEIIDDGRTSEIDSEQHRAALAF
jgi:branched-chain amino acid transport system ATP-binding protein